MATDAAEAVAGADVVVTMLFDADSVAQVMEWALPAVAPDAVWAQTATVGLDGTERLAELAGPARRRLRRRARARHPKGPRSRGR